MTERSSHPHLTRLGDEALRDELGDVGLDPRLGVKAPAERGEREAHEQHALRLAHGRDERILVKEFYHGAEFIYQLVRELARSF